MKCQNILVAMFNRRNKRHIKRVFGNVIRVSLHGTVRKIISEASERRKCHVFKEMTKY